MGLWCFTWSKTKSPHNGVHITWLIEKWITEESCLNLQMQHRVNCSGFGRLFRQYAGFSKATSVKCCLRLVFTKIVFKSNGWLTLSDIWVSHAIIQEIQSGQSNMDSQWGFWYSSLKYGFCLYRLFRILWIYWNGMQLEWQVTRPCCTINHVQSFDSVYGL